MASYISVMIAFGKYVHYLKGRVQATNEQCKILLETVEPLKDIISEHTTEKPSDISTKIVRKLEVGLDKLMRYLLKATKKNFIKRGLNISKERNKIKSYVNNIIILVGEYNMAALNKANNNLEALPNIISEKLGNYLEDKLCAKFEDLKKFIQETNQNLIKQIDEAIQQRGNNYCESLNKILKTEIIDFETFWMKFDYVYLINSKFQRYNIDKAKIALKYYFTLNRQYLDIKRMIIDRKTSKSIPIFLDEIDIFLSTVWDFEYSKTLFIENQIIIPSQEDDRNSSGLVFLSLSDSFTPGGVSKGTKYFVEREISNDVIPFLCDDNNPIAYLDENDFCWYLTPANEYYKVYYLLETPIVLQGGLSFLINCGNEFLTLEIPLDSIKAPDKSNRTVNTRAFPFDLIFNNMKYIIQGNYELTKNESNFVLEKCWKSPVLIKFEDVNYSINKVPDLDVWVNVCEGKEFGETKFLLDSTTTLLMNYKEFKIIYVSE
ncbi:hypothetical protein SteCoe_6408 [Stentor coeruleus]|uniref:Uncharacterized protein n=1 Tax=Stentor coeruleus TaxID=5963 RepID=A0A1R2CQ69_9CILI|nr:hypothetical protein SteCoe_6408 [Stentor coeruleus]